MKRSEIYKDICLYILDNIAIDPLDKEDKEDDISNGKLKGVFEGVSGLGNYKAIAERISSWEDEWETEINVSSEFKIGEATGDGEIEMFKDFAIHNKDKSFACITSDKLKEIICSDSISRESLRIIEQIWTAIHSDSREKDSIRDLLTAPSSRKYLIASTHDLSDRNKRWNQYCYAYFLYVNSHGFAMDPSLTYDSNLPFKASRDLPYAHRKAYGQYFEIYSLISESHYCEDVLSRFLNMYQILENMCYRRYLVELTPKNPSESIRRGFVRKAITKFSKGLDAENKEIPSGITDIFPNLNQIFSGDFNRDERTFLNKEYGFSLQLAGSPLPDLKKREIADIIYQIRNSIVHNKATELHFSFINTQEYQEIIPMIHNIVSKMENAIAEKINKVEANHKLDFNIDHIKLYY